MTMAKLQAAIRDAREAMPGIALKLFRAPPEVRTLYRQYRQECTAWCNVRPHGAAFAAVLGGEEPVHVPVLLRQSIMPPAPILCAGDDCGAIWHRYLTGGI